jgi:methionyl-tRNA formyltransferase
MALDAGVDTGPMLAQRIGPIDASDTRVTLAGRLAREGAVLVREALGAWVRGDQRAVPQPERGASYAPRLEKHEAEIDWRAHPLCIWRHVRAFHGWPGAFTSAGSEILKVHVVQPVDLITTAAPGTIVQADERHGVHVACGGGTLEIVELQRPGRRAVSGREWLRGRDVRVGMRLGRPEAE